MILFLIQYAGAQSQNNTNGTAVVCVSYID